jgi:D-tyrosyl-tRNA(Tyr) deacylase
MRCGPQTLAHIYIYLDKAEDVIPTTTVQTSGMFTVHNSFGVKPKTRRTNV